jgi:hypothetical protein
MQTVGVEYRTQYCRDILAVVLSSFCFKVDFYLYVSSGFLFPQGGDASYLSGFTSMFQSARRVLLPRFTGWKL